jgi:hypothetical protein
MASVWIAHVATKSGEPRYRVLYRIGGRESTPRYGGVFKRKRDATTRAAWVSGELAAMRVPNLRLLVEPVRAPTFAEAAERWRASRVDVSEGTRLLHQVALKRAVPTLGSVRLDDLTAQHFVDLIETLAAGGSKRETIRKTVKYAASVLDDCGIEPNPARDRRVRLPHEEDQENLSRPRQITAGPSSARSRPRIDCRCSGSTGQVLASHRSRRCSSVTTTRRGGASDCASP